MRTELLQYYKKIYQKLQLFDKTIIEVNLLKIAGSAFLHTNV